MTFWTDFAGEPAIFGQDYFLPDMVARVNNNLNLDEWPCLSCDRYNTILTEFMDFQVETTTVLTVDLRLINLI